MHFNIGSIVAHPLFVGPGTITAFHDNNGKTIVEVFWQSFGKVGFHSLDNLKLMCEKQNG